MDYSLDKLFFVLDLNDYIEGNEIRFLFWEL